MLLTFDLLSQYLRFDPDTLRFRGFRHSYLSDSTGFLVAAFQLCQLTVNKAIARVNNPVRTNTHQLNSVLYAKFSSQRCITNQADGIAIKKAMAIHLTISLFSIIVISAAFAPLTLRIPISLVRCLAENKAIPNRPMHEITIEIPNDAEVKQYFVYRIVFPKIFVSHIFCNNHVKRFI